MPYKNLIKNREYKRLWEVNHPDWREAYRLKNKERIKKRQHEYYLKNKERFLEGRKKYAKKYRKNNVKKIKENSKKYYLKNKEKQSIYQKEYLLKNAEKVLIRNRNKYNNDINHRLKVNLRSRLLLAIKYKQKSGSAIKDLGCSIEEFKIYIESKFKPGMSWENRGYRTWHIDHIEPLANFDLTNRNQFLQACHYTNLQPMWAKENFSKGKKYDPTIPTSTKNNPRG